jgi:FkbM family methyltransferase
MNEYYNVIKNKTNILVKNILEIGSRDGNDANSLKNLFQIPNENVWVVEPNPKQVEIIKKTYPNFNLVPYAIFDRETEHDFYQVNTKNLDEIGTSSLINRYDNWYESKVDIIKVKTITGKQLLYKIQEEIDICKIDVEGLTYEVLDSFGDEITKIKSFHLECEHRLVWKNQKMYDEIVLFLSERKYVQIYFQYCSNDTLQSDSVWILEKYLN